MKKNKKNKADWLVGKWRYEEAVRPLIFTIEKTARGFRIQAIDDSDGEALVVSKVRWDGKVLTFDTLTPSNKWRTRNSLKVISKTKAIHELTFWEPWEKVRQ
ncbi:MAG TPA: hypothetical protein VME24_01415 [Alphaproteobacteria bacterium]|nr:hypothetical protein [Alphaproteobacteria bacterium]